MKQTTAKKAPAPRTAEATEPKSTLDRTVDLVDRGAELSDDVLKSVEAGGRAAIAAVRKFVDTVDEALPAIGDRPTRRETIVDSALDMADKLVVIQSDFLRNIVRSADRTLTKK
jgi:hypothetical protein